MLQWNALGFRTRLAACGGHSGRLLPDWEGATESASMEPAPVRVFLSLSGLFTACCSCCSPAESLVRSVAKPTPRPFPSATSLFSRHPGARGCVGGRCCQVPSLRGAAPVEGDPTRRWLGLGAGCLCLHGCGQGGVSVFWAKQRVETQYDSMTLTRLDW